MFVLCLLPILMWFGSGDVENDEAIYSFVVEKMVETGEWLTPVSIFDGHTPFLEKPPLKFWLSAIALELGAPIDNWGLRLVDAILTVLIFGYLFALGRWFGGRWAGLLTCLVFFAIRKPLMLHGLLANNMESALVLQYTAGMYHFLALIDGRPGRRLHILAIGLLFVLGFMSKFVAALFFPLIMAAVLAIHPRLFRRVAGDYPMWIVTGLLALLLIAPWFVYQHVTVGSDFWADILGIHVIERFAGTLVPDHLRPWRFYLVLTFMMVVEGGAFLAYPIGLWFVARDYLARRDPKVTALFVWYLIPVISMSLMTSKLTHYLYPFVPPVAIVCGIGLARLTGMALPWPEHRKERIGRLPGSLSGFRWNRIQFAVALAPIIIAYGVAFHDIRFRSGPFEALQACLEAVDDRPETPMYFGAEPFANHVFSRYTSSTRSEADPELIVSRLYGPHPTVVWLAQSTYRRLLATDPRVRSVVAHRMEPAEVSVAAGQKEPAILLLPARFAHCGDRITREGATPLHGEDTEG